MSIQLFKNKDIKIKKVEILSLKQEIISKKVIPIRGKRISNMYIKGNSGTDINIVDVISGTDY